MAWSSAVVAAAIIVLGVTGVFTPDGAPGGPDKADAATLEGLARTSAGGPTLRAGQFDFVWTVFSGGGTSSMQQLWTSVSGEVWGYSDPGNTVQPAVGPFCIHRVPNGGDYFDEPSAKFLAAMPTEPSALYAFLRDHATGSESKDEAVFVAVGDLLRSELPSPRLRAAAFRALEMTPHVHAYSDVVDARGRITVQVDFTGRHGVRQSLYFDPTTSRVVEEATVDSGSSGARTVTIRAGIVSSVPTSVIDCATSPNHRGLTEPPVH